MRSLISHDRSSLEAAVITAIAGGATAIEVAGRLCLYEDTVRRPRRSVMRSRAASDRQQMVLLLADARRCSSETLRFKSYE